MKFLEHCKAASVRLQQIFEIIEDLEASYARLEEDRSSTDLLTHIVQGLFKLKSLSEEILHAHLPFIQGEEASVAKAIQMAHDEFMRRAWAVRHDLEVLTKVARRSRRAPLRRVG